MMLPFTIFIAYIIFSDYMLTLNLLSTVLSEELKIINRNLLFSASFVLGIIILNHLKLYRKYS